MSEHTGKIVLGSIVAIVIAISAFVGLFYLSTSSPSATTSVAHSSSETESKTSNYTVYPTTAYSNASSSGLEVRLLANSSEIRSNGTLNLIVSEFNTLATSNNVSANANWPYKGTSALQPTVGPCGPLNYPMGIEVFGGYFTHSNISSAANPLDLFNPVSYACPLLYNIHYFVFDPTSENGSFYASYEYNNSTYCCKSPLPMYSQVAATIDIQEYWNGPNNGHPLMPGVYTILGEDEWGDVALLNFAVV